ncbi:MAG: triose-phosphate isomerase [Parcubacteria group bacterium RIFCSPHIGHO2_01_FULL_56_18]|nr:MAG: triose-phosphate isomerase [Parcubacteria group bacterium RIFCSPHIGHO2_01_FULL_56_18]
MKSLIVANWKMNPATAKEAMKLIEATKKATVATKGVSVIIAPPSIFLRDVAQQLGGGKIGLAAQHVHFENAGSFTGEISIPQIHDAKATYAIVGHAERRAMGETNEEVGKKVAALLEAKMTPILCIGEQIRTPAGEHFLFVKEQLRTGLHGVSPAKIGKVIIAYEPVWAIGAAHPMQPRDMHEMSIFIRKTIVEKYGDLGMNNTVLYGGAVDAASAPSMLRDGDVKGFLVGRASVDAKAFVELLSAASKA